MYLSQADNSVKIWRNLPISNSKPDLLTVNTYSKFGENSLLFINYPEMKVWACLKQITVKIWRNLPISNPKPDLLNVNAYSKFDENPCHLLKLSLGNKNLGVSRADNSVKIWRNLPISNPKPDLLNVNAYSKLVKIPCYLLKL